MKNLKTIVIMSGMFALMAMPLKAQKWEHLADTPQMGWSTWNKFQGNISEDIIKGIADAMVENNAMAMDLSRSILSSSLTE